MKTVITHVLQNIECLFEKFNAFAAPSGIANQRTLLIWVTISFLKENEALVDFPLNQASNNICKISLYLSWCTESSGACRI